MWQKFKLQGCYSKHGTILMSLHLGHECRNRNSVDGQTMAAMKEFQAATACVTWTDSLVQDSTHISQLQLYFAGINFCLSVSSLAVVSVTQWVRSSLLAAATAQIHTHTLLQIFCECYTLTAGVLYRWQQTRAAQQQLARSTVQQTEPALARLAVQSLGMHEPMSLSVEADQIVPSDEDVSQASMVAVMWLLSGMLSLNPHGMNVLRAIFVQECMMSSDLFV